MAAVVVHILLAASLCGVSCLTWKRAPSLVLWKLAIVVGELGHLLVLIPILLGGMALRTAHFPTWGLSMAVVLHLLTTVNLLIPSLRGAKLAKSLPQALAAAFGPAALGREPWSWRRAFLAAPSRAITRPETINYVSSGETLCLDLFRARSGGAAPCVIVIHGGGWDNGERTQFEAFSAYLAERGYAVASLQYRLAPRWTWPAQRDDVLAAIAYLQENAAAFGVDPHRVVLLGRSAGGQIAESVAYAGSAKGVRGVIAFYAPADLHFAWKHTPGADLLDCFRLMRQYTGGTPETKPAVFDDASPLFSVSARSVPTLIAHGQCDPLVWHRQSVRLAARLRELGVPVYFLDLPWGTHAFDFFFQGPGGQLSTYAIEWFLEVTCRADRDTGPKASTPLAQVEPD